MKRMKLSLLLFISIFLANSVIAQQVNVQYYDNWGQAGFTLVETKNDGVIVNYSIKDFSLVTNNIDGENLQNISLPGALLFNDAGMPDLPGQGRTIAIPEGSTPVLTIVNIRTEIIPNVDIAPAPIIPMDADNQPMVYKKDNKIYSTDAFYPAKPVITSKVTQIRGVDVVTLGVTPFQYNPVTKELKIIRDIEVEISFEGGNGEFGNNRLRSRFWDPILAQNLLNYNSLPKIDYSKNYNNAKVDGEAEYVILTLNDPDFLSWADSIKTFRRQQGILTEIYTIDEIGGNTVTAIDNWVTDIYNNWSTPPAAILILADYGTGSDGITSNSWPHPYAGTYVSDNHYADVDGDDLPDIVFARMTAQNDAHLEVMVTKFLQYERTPPTSEYFYNNPITALGWQTERWFQICSEVVGGFWNSLGKTTVRINAVYDGNPSSDPWSTATNTTTIINYFGPNGLGYVPATPAELGGWTGGNATMINAAINAGAFMLQHRDHGLETGWGEPSYTNSSISGLTNSDMPYIWSINCLTGNFDLGYEVFAEKFHRYTYDGHNSGAVGIMAATQVSYSFVNDAFVWGAYDNMWPDFMPDYGTEFPNNYIYPAFAGAAGKHFLYASNWPYNTDSKQITYRLFHQHGDAFLNIYSEVPQDLTVDCPDVMIFGNNTLDITVDDGADIAVTYFNEDNEEVDILGYAHSNGGTTTVTLNDAPNHDEFVLVTITKQNYYRYTKYVQVVTPTGPYIVKKSVAIDDANWNDNGMADYDEVFNIDLELENVGTETATGVTATLTTTDPYVTGMTNNVDVDFSDIAAGSTAISSGSFTVDLADSIPDGHKISFNLVISDGSKTIYESSFNVNVNAPVLQIEFDDIQDLAGLDFSSSPLLSLYEDELYSYNISVIEIVGNQNGILDPGEIATIVVDMGNTGHSLFNSAICWLESTSPEIIILTDTMQIGDIDINEYIPAEFTISVSNDASIGTPIELVFHLMGGAYQYENTFSFSIGQIIEDFESGDFLSYNWTMGGNADWLVESSDVYEGVFSAQSGDISDNQTSSFSISGDVAMDDVISFYYKVDSESSWDYLRFFIDGVEQDAYSGLGGAWTQAIFNVSAGTHTFKWEYDKDGSVSSGSDCAWIDYIEFPAMNMSKATKDPITITANALPAWLTLTDNGDGSANLSGTAPVGVMTYDVELEATDGTAVTNQMFSIDVLHFVNILENDANINIYPIPANNVLNIDLSETPNNTSVSIFNSVGQVVLVKQLTSTNNQIDISKLASGTYFVEIFDGKEFTRNKLIIK
ncbi:MAG: T9SS type A sorting domain-containing protein [Bacteroidales bacterium]|nr:T9SS type A sorting domain-containing protein [Bacteroidales bacterium]